MIYRKVFDTPRREKSGGVRFLIGRQLKQGRRKVKLGLLKKSIVGGDVKSISELNSTHRLKLKILARAKPEPELLSAIKEQISPTRYSVLEEVRRVWKKLEQQKLKNRERLKS